MDAQTIANLSAAHAKAQKDLAASDPGPIPPLPAAALAAPAPPQVPFSVQVPLIDGTSVTAILPPLTPQDAGTTQGTSPNSSLASGQQLPPQ
jgi:hypothetical protein